MYTIVNGILSGPCIHACNIEKKKTARVPIQVFLEEDQVAPQYMGGRRNARLVGDTMVEESVGWVKVRREEEDKERLAWCFRSTMLY